MTVADRLLDWLARRPATGDAAIVGWRVEVAEGESARVGVRNSRPGGPYDGPAAALRETASLRLYWSDGQQTRGALDHQSLSDPDSVLAAWRATAFREREGRLSPLAGPATVPDVQTLDSDIALAVRSDPWPLFDLLERARGQMLAAGVRRVDGELHAGYGRRTVATSAGFRADWEETTCTLELWGDEIAPARFGRRCRPSPAEVERLVAEVATLAPLLSWEAVLPPASRGAILMPALVDQMLERLLLPNLAGRAIRDGRSPFTRDDVSQRPQVIGPDLQLMVDSTLPFELSTAPCNQDGIPAGRVALIQRGRLVSPILDLATALDFGLPPTPWPRARPHALLRSDAPLLDMQTALGLLGDGVIVRDLPGLHTQQPRHSRYALIAPDALAIVSGVADGRCTARVAGNLLDHLSQPSTRLVRVPGELGVGLLVLTGIEILAA